MIEINLLYISYLGLIILGICLFPLFIYGWYIAFFTEKGFTSNKIIEYMCKGVIIGTTIITIWWILDMIFRFMK